MATSMIAGPLTAGQPVMTGIRKIRPWHALKPASLVDRPSGVSGNDVAIRTLADYAASEPDFKGMGFRRKAGEAGAALELASSNANRRVPA